MQTSSQSLNDEQLTALKRQLYTLVADLRHPDQVEIFFAALFSELELMVFAKRLAILRLLSENKSYEFICAQLKVSSATISSIAEQRQKPGMKLAIKLISLDNWAERVRQRIKQLFGYVIIG